MTWIHRERLSAPASAINEPPRVDWRNVTTSVTRPGRTPASARRARRSSTGSSSSGSVGMPSHPARTSRSRSGTAAVARARLRSCATTLPASTAARAAAPVATPKATRTVRPVRARSRDPASQTGYRARRIGVTSGWLGPRRADGCEELFLVAVLHALRKRLPAHEARARREDLEEALVIQPPRSRRLDHAAYHRKRLALAIELPGGEVVVRGSRVREPRGSIRLAGRGPPARAGSQGGPPASSS